MSYTFSQDILKISSLQTKTFKIDYITSVREGTAITKASVDSAPIEVGSETENEGEADVTRGGGKLDNIIKTIEKFDFWEKFLDRVASPANKFVVAEFWQIVVECNVFRQRDRKSVV